MANALELLQAYLQRASAGGGSDPDWLAHLAELGDSLPSRDMVERAPGQSYQGYIGEQLHPNALGIYAQPRVPPAGDEVIRPEQTYAAPAMPRVSASNEQRWFSQQINPSYFPGPDGSTRIAAGSPFGQQPPSPELLKQMMEWWTATQARPQQLGLNSMLSR
jgi:hypothetical protein